jgi:deoxyribodipyrimidine photo-lyase
LRKDVLPIFIFNRVQISPKSNAYFGRNTVQFMLESLVSLNAELKNKLLCFETDRDDTDVLKLICSQVQVKSIAFNADITPFARQRDAKIKDWCQKNNIECVSHNDYCLIDPAEMEKPYQVFTPYYNKYKQTKIRKPLASRVTFVKQDKLKKLRAFIPMKSIFDAYLPGELNKEIAVRGGRDEGVRILRNIRKGHFKHYDRTRNFFHMPTTKLSTYLKYGCISIREAYYAMKSNGPLVRELFFRSFYDQVIFHFERTLHKQVHGSENKSLRTAYDKIRWRRSKSSLDMWKAGKTGFPIVDAGMRELLHTGFMHNRSRMIVSSFLVKDMFLDWRLGEKHFANYLVDYYPPSNNQGWTFASGSGADAQQYNRVFSPWIQSKKYDPNCEYIKKWVPELEAVSPEDIHNWDSKYVQYKHIEYPKPCLDHSIAVKKNKMAYKKVLA